MTTAVPPAALDPALAALHTHYRALLTAERHSHQLERQIWDSERSMYQRRISALEAKVPEGTTTSAIIETTTTAAVAVGDHAEAQVEEVEEEEVEVEVEVEEEEEEEEEEEIPEIEMRQLLREASRVVYPSRHRPRGRSLADTPEESLVAEFRPKQKEEVVELRLKKTSNFGMEFGRAWGGR